MGDENDRPSDVRLRIARFEQNAQKKILPATPSKAPKQLSPVNPSPNETSHNKSSPANSPPVQSVSPLQQLHNRNNAVTMLPQTTDKSVDLKPTSPVYAAGIKINRDPMLSPVHPPPSSPGKPLGSSIFPKVQLKSPNTTAVTGVGSKFSPSPGSTVAPSLPTGSSKRDSGRSTGSELVKVGSRTYRKIVFVAPLRFIRLASLLSLTGRRLICLNINSNYDNNNLSTVMTTTPFTTMLLLWPI